MTHMFSSIAIIGAGTIGSLLVEQCASFFSNATLIACDHSSRKLTELQGRLAGLVVTASAAEAAAAADLIFFAVKPQSFAALAREIFDQTKPDALAVSVMAGVSLKTVAASTGIPKVIRTMPNTPSRIGRGVIGFIANDVVSSAEKDTIQDFFKNFGLVIPCASESDIDRLTAVSGSGPAYVFYMMESLIAAAQELGLTETQALEVVRATFTGASALAQEEQPSLLRAQVTSPGGTTEAAMKVFEDRGMRGIWRSAIQAAYTRAEELGRH